MVESLSDISIRELVSVESLRATIRRAPALKGLGRLCGNTRVFTGAEAAQIMAAHRERVGRTNRGRAAVARA